VRLLPVFPTHVGVFLDSVRARFLPRGFPAYVGEFPRTRSCQRRGRESSPTCEGGVPKADGYLHGIRTLSSRTWGCFHGIVLIQKQAKGLPHVRGGVPPDMAETIFYGDLNWKEPPTKFSTHSWLCWLSLPVFH
jgi:hypothetical protein